MDSVTPPEAAAAAAPPSLLRHRSFLLFWCVRTFTNGAYQMQAVAVGWQLYDLTNDPLDLGLVGLMQFFPVVLFALIIGQAADHFEQTRAQVFLNALEVGFGLDGLPDFLLGFVLAPGFVQLILQERSDLRTDFRLLQNLESVRGRKTLGRRCRRAEERD